MKIYCPICNYYILNTSNAFVIGGPYDGSMFQKGTNRRLQVSSNFFKFTPNTRKGSLTCPMCDGNIVKRDGSILCEHGLVREGQKTIDTRFSVIHRERKDFKLKTKREWSWEIKEDRVKAAALEQQKRIEEEFGQAQEATESEVEEEKREPTRAEKVKQMRADGVTWAAIAEKLGISVSTAIKDLKNNAD